MKAIFLSDTKEHLENVYAQKCIDFLQQEAGIDTCFYNKAMIEANPRQFTEVQYIFSTWGMPLFTEEEIKTYFPLLQCVFYSGGTVQYFARPFLNCGVKVFSAWAANAIPVAEYTVAQIILANKGYYKALRLMKDKKHAVARKAAEAYWGNYGHPVGIIGAGMIGKQVITMLKNYALDCLVFDPFLPDSQAEILGVTKCSLEEMFTTCKVISNHLANNDKTKGMLQYSLFKTMPFDATFINTGRGAQVVEEDLIKVLTERKDITALLDVTDPEPPKEDSMLYQLENCFLTPHIAGSMGKEVWRMADYMVEEYKRYISNEKCLYEVNLKMLETMA